MHLFILILWIWNHHFGFYEHGVEYLSLPKFKLTYDLRSQVKDVNQTSQFNLTFLCYMTTFLELLSKCSFWSQTSSKYKKVQNNFERLSCHNISWHTLAKWKLLKHDCAKNDRKHLLSSPKKAVTIKSMKSNHGRVGTNINKRRVDENSFIIFSAWLDSSQRLAKCPLSFFMLTWRIIMSNWWVFWKKTLHYLLKE